METNLKFILIAKYVVIATSGYLFIQQLLKIIYILFRPKWLSGKRYGFPTSKFEMVGYYLCAMLVMAMAFLARVGLL